MSGNYSSKANIEFVGWRSRRKKKTRKREKKSTGNDKITNHVRNLEAQFICIHCRRKRDEPPWNLSNLPNLLRIALFLYSFLQWFIVFLPGARTLTEFIKFRSIQFFTVIDMNGTGLVPVYQFFFVPYPFFRTNSWGMKMRSQ